MSAPVIRQPFEQEGRVSTQSQPDDPTLRTTYIEIYQRTRLRKLDVRQREALPGVTWG
jgi:hypothetical protein